MEIEPSSSGAVTGEFNPYDFAGIRYPDWVIRHDDLHGIPELMCWRRKVVLLEQTHDKYKRRCSFAHALGHLEYLHKGSVLDGKEEAAANKWAAGMLISLDSLTTALEWHGWQICVDLAHDLCVDLETLQTRIGMARRHPAEHRHLTGRRAQLEHAA